VATTFNTSVISGFGYVVRERSSDGTITYRVKEKAKDKGKDKWFIITRPDGTSSGKIRSITMGPDGKISFTPFFEKEKEEKEEKDPLDPRNHR